MAKRQLTALATAVLAADAAAQTPLTRYDFVNLATVMIAAYSLSFILYRQGKITVRAHRRVWNILLLFTFTVCAALGVLLLLRINYGIVVSLPLDMLYWHVEAGIAMTVISVFHILWHLQYFKSAFMKAPEKITKGRKGR